jgi:hypothetical protein
LRRRSNCENAEPVFGFVGEIVRRYVDEGVRFEAEGAADAMGAAVASGKDVGVGIADHDGFVRGDGGSRECGGLGDERSEAVRIRLLGVKAVGTVVLEEKAGEAEVVADIARGIDGFVCQDRHQQLRSRSMNGFE